MGGGTQDHDRYQILLHIYFLYQLPYPDPAMFTVSRLVSPCAVLEAHLGLRS